MDAGLSRIFKEAESNIYKGIRLSNGAIVFMWTLLCLFVANKSSSFTSYAVSGGIYYTSVVAICIYLFKGMGRYLHFPEDNKKMPVFIGHKLDILFTYPVIVMAAAGLISNLLLATGLFQTPPKADVSSSSVWTETVRVLLMPLLAYGEELLNLLIVSFIYKYMKLKVNLRISTSIVLAALIFGFMHTFGQGAGAAIPIGVSHIPVIFAALYTGNIWVSFLAHLYINLISLAKAYSNGLHTAIIAAVSLIPALWAVKSMFRKHL